MMTKNEAINILSQYLNDEIQDCYEEDGVVTALFTINPQFEYPDWDFRKVITFLSANNIDLRTEENLILEAIRVQDACNLSGVIKSFDKAIKRLRELHPDKGTDFINRHRVSRLYADKIKSLTGELKTADFCTVNLTNN